MIVCGHFLGLCSWSLTRNQNQNHIQTWCKQSVTNWLEDTGIQVLSWSAFVCLQKQQLIHPSLWPLMWITKDLTTNTAMCPIVNNYFVGKFLLSILLWRLSNLIHGLWSLNEYMREWLTCLMVTAGRQSFSSSSRDRHTVPDG